MGHTDVVPVNPDGWSQRPVRRRAGRRRGVGPRAPSTCSTSRRRWPSPSASWPTEGFRPKGTLIYFGVADEEAGGHWGAEYMIDEHWDAVGADYVLTETGGWSQVGRDGIRHVTVNVAEKGLAWRRLRVARHAGSRLDALRRRQRADHRGRDRPPPRRLPAAAQPRRPVAGPHRLDGPARRPAGRARRPGPHRRRASPRCRPTYARVAHACSHTTISPNVIHGGQKTNTIPDVIDIDVDIRTVPGDTREVVDGYLRRGARRARRPGRDLADPGVRVDPLPDRQPAVGRARRATPRSPTPAPTSCPGIITGGTDARFYRAKGCDRLRRRACSPRT